LQSSLIAGGSIHADLESFLTQITTVRRGSPETPMQRLIGASRTACSGAKFLTTTANTDPAPVRTLVSNSSDRKQDMPNRLLRRRWGKPDDAMPLAVARDIVEAYGQVLETRDESTWICDASALPYPKDEIKRALRVVLAAPGVRLVKPMLRKSYVLLAHWQEGYVPLRVPAGSVDAPARARVTSEAGGADLSERFEIRPRLGDIEPGSVVCIDTEGGNQFHSTDGTIAWNAAGRNTHHRAYIGCILL